MREPGNLPAQAGAGHLHVLEEVPVAARKLPRLVGHQHRGQADTRGFAEMLRDGRAGRRRVEVADDHQHEVVRHVAGAIIGQQVLVAVGREHIAVADDRLAVGMHAEGGFEQGLGEPLVGIVEAHVDLPQDDFLFLRHLPGGQDRMEHGIGEQVDGHGGVRGRHVDVIHRAVKRGVGVDVAPVGLHRRGNLPAGPALRALEEHVLEVVREAGPQIRALVHAAGLDPHLDGADRGRGVALQEDGESVGEGIALDGFAPEVFEQDEVAGTGRLRLGHVWGKGGTRETPAISWRARAIRRCGCGARSPAGTASQRPRRNRRCRQNPPAGHSPSC